MPITHAYTSTKSDPADATNKAKVTYDGDPLP